MPLSYVYNKTKHVRECIIYRNNSDYMVFRGEGGTQFMGLMCSIGNSLFIQILHMSPINYGTPPPKNHIIAMVAIYTLICISYDLFHIPQRPQMTCISLEEVNSGTQSVALSAVVQNYMYTANCCSILKCRVCILPGINLFSQDSGKNPGKTQPSHGM